MFYKLKSFVAFFKFLTCLLISRAFGLLYSWVSKMYLKRLSRYSCYAFTCFGFLLGFVAETHQRHQHFKVAGVWGISDGILKLLDFDGLTILLSVLGIFLFLRKANLPKAIMITHTGGKSSKFLLYSCLSITTYTQIAFFSEMIE